MLARRNFLMTLAALPAALLHSAQQEHKLVLVLEEVLPSCAASITACWHLSAGSDLNSIVPQLDSSLPLLLYTCQYASAYRAVAAELVAQIYLLKTILAWHL